MKANMIEEVSKNLVFKNIEEEAELDFKNIYNESPLEVMLFNKNNDYSFSLSLNSLTESITISYCFKQLSHINLIESINSIGIKNNNISLNNTVVQSSTVLPLQNNTIDDDFLEVVKKFFQKNLKYVSYLYHHKESIDILNIHKFITSSTIISYYSLFKYLIAERSIIDKNNEYVNFLLFLISTIDDLKISFDKKWGPILNGIVEISDFYCSKKSLENEKTNNFIKKIVKSIIKFCYNLISLKNNQKYKFYKYMFENELMFKASISIYNNNPNEFLYTKYLHNLSNIGFSGQKIKSNFKVSVESFKEYKNNIKKLKSYIDNFNDNKLKKLKEDNEVFPTMFFENYYDDLKESMDKYSKELDKIKIKL